MAVFTQSGSIPAAAESASAPAAGAQMPSDFPAEELVLPRSMRPYWHVFLAFGLAWVLIGGYVYSMSQRFSRLEEELLALRRPR
jgi:CcmD family protein